MKRILDDSLLNHYYKKYEIGSIFDNDIINYLQLHFFKKDEFILHSQTELEYYYLLVEGKLKISYSFENGKSMFLKFYKGFNTIGDIELLKNKPIRCDVEAIEDTYLIAVPSEVLREKYMDNPNFLRHLVDYLSEKLDATINNSSYNFLYPLNNRLASYLIDQITDENLIILNVSYKEIAEFLGTSYRHLSRTFKELEEEGIIKCENKTIYILEKKKFRELAKNVYVIPE